MKKYLYCTLFVFACIFIAVTVRAENTTGVTLEEIVVTATRDREEIRKIPANVSVITAKEIEESGASSIVDVLETLEGINFRTSSGNPSQASIDMRGFGGDNPHGRTLIMLDGRRLNRPDMMSVNWLQIPMKSIERIEIVRGAGSVLYGDAAIAGVINIITKKGREKREINASVMAGSYGLHDEGGEISGSRGKLSYAVTVENQETSGYRDRSEFDSKSAGVKAGFDASDYVGLSWGVSFNRTDYEMPGGLSRVQMEENRKQAVNPYDDASNEYVNADFRMESFLGDFGEFDAAVLYGKKEIDSNLSSYLIFARWEIDTLGITPRYSIEKKIRGHDNKLLAGFDYYTERLHRDGFADREKTTKTIEADLEKRSLGFYLRNEFNVRENLIFTLGYRDERSKIEGTHTTIATMTRDFEGEKLHKGEAFEAGLTCLVGERSRLFARYGKVYRYPFLDEQASYQGWGTVFLTDLDAEKGASYELGANLWPMEHMNVGLTLYEINMEDEIAYNNATFKSENLDDTRHRGIELSLSYLWEKYLKLYGNFTYQDAEFRNGMNSGNEIPLVPRRMANGGLELYLPYGCVLRPEVHYVGSSYLGGDYDNNKEKLDSYTVCNLFLFCRQEIDALNFSAFFGVENLTDEKYSTMGYEGIPGFTPDSYYPSPEITVKSGITLEF
jgi:iron complex outermembrane receptor protein